MPQFANVGGSELLHGVELHSTCKILNFKDGSQCESRPWLDLVLFSLMNKRGMVIETMSRTLGTAGMVVVA